MAPAFKTDLVLMPLQRADGVSLILGYSLRQDGGHDEDHRNAQDVARVGIQINDFNVVIVAVPACVQQILVTIFMSQLIVYLNNKLRQIRFHIFSNFIKAFLKKGITF